MEDKKKNKREWVKTAAIIFLTIMLILTFFSNTIMNYSLPEVATQYVAPDTITAKIRGSGTVESVDPYNIEVTESRKISSVAVRVGDTVQKGDVIYYLDDTESEELKAAKDTLEAAQNAYDKGLLTDSITSGIINEFNQNISTATYRSQISNAQAEKEAAQTKVDTLQKKVDALDAQIAAIPENTADITAETKNLNTAKANLDAANVKQTIAQNALDDLQAKETNLKAKYELSKELEASVSDGDTSESEALNAQLVEIRTQIVSAENDLNVATANAKTALLAYTQAETALNNKKNSGDTSGTRANLTNQRNSLNVELTSANVTLAEKTKALSDLVNNINQVLGLQDLYDAIVKAQEDVTALEKKSIGTTIVSDITGTVSSLAYTAGQTTNPGSPVAVIQPADKGFLFTFAVTNDQAKRLSKGDVAEVVNSWRYDDIEVVLTNIKNDPANPGQGKLLEFTVKGDVTDGQSLSVSVGQRSANYDLVVPNSAIREDNNGKFILIVESKSSPLGNRYIANRVDVQVLASDDTKSAISGALYGYEFAITTSTKPVEAGKQIRLADN